MKKILAILLSLTLVLGLSACSSGQEPASTGQNAESAESAAPSSEAAAASTPAETVPAVSESEEERFPISEGVPYVDGDDYYEFDCSKELDENGYYNGFDPAASVTLPESLSASIPYDVHTPSEEKFDEALHEIIDFYATDEQIVDRAVADGDSINIDFTGTLDGVAFQGGSTGGYGTTVTVGVTNYVDNFLQKLIGHKPGETFDIDITFPADYGNAELAGKKTVFNVTINYIVGDKIMPELTDEFVATNLSSRYGWKTVEEMNAKIRSDLANDAIEEYLYNYLIDNSQVSGIPIELSNYMMNYFIYYHSYVAKGSEVTLPVLIANFGFSSMSDMLTDYAPDIAQACREEMIVQAAAKELNVELTKEDLEGYFMEELGRTDYSIYEENFGLPYVKKMVLSWKVMNLMEEQATLLPQ